MSTRSSIAILNPDRSVTSVYCHFDGYIKGVGSTLHSYYKTEEEVRELIHLGDLSSLGPSLKKTVAYHRDRGESYTRTKPAEHSSVREWLENEGEDYNYIFNTNTNKWEVYEGRRGPKTYLADFF